MEFTEVQRLDLAKYMALLEKWQKSINLVSSRTLDDAWRRHILDSAQLLQIAPTAKHWIDLGSGAGFPGLVLAILLKGSNGRVDLVESDARKVAFLRTVSRETNAAATVHHGRIEVVLPKLSPPHVITARALAPMVDLLKWTEGSIRNGAVGLFLKGQDIDSELMQIANCSMFRISKIPSFTDSRASVVKVTRVE